LPQKEGAMAQKNRNVQNLDAMAKRFQQFYRSAPLRVRETVETWQGRGWGLRIERQRVETTIEAAHGDDKNEG
jgi:hypothetical protein